MCTTSRRRSVRAGPIALATLAGAGLAAPASAQTPPPVPGEAAVQQYREALPTGWGLVVPGEGEHRVAPLPPRIAQRIEAEGGADASLLGQVATSSDYGAPQSGIRARPGSGKSGRRVRTRETPSGLRVRPDSGVSRLRARGRDTPSAVLAAPSLGESALAVSDAMTQERQGPLGLLAALLLAVTVAVTGASSVSSRARRGAGARRS